MLLKHDHRISRCTFEMIFKISFPLYLFFPPFSLTQTKSLSWSGIRCLMPILLQLVLRGYYSRTIGSPLLPIPTSATSRRSLESFRRESARRRPDTEAWDIVAIVHSKMSVLPANKDFNDLDFPLAFLVKFATKIPFVKSIYERIIENKKLSRRCG